MSEVVQTFTSGPVFSLRNLLNYCLEGSSQAARILGCSEVLTIQYTNFHLIDAPSHPLVSSPIHPSSFKCSVPLVQTPWRINVFSARTGKGQLLGCWSRARGRRSKDFRQTPGQPSSSAPSTPHLSLWTFLMPPLLLASYHCHYILWFQLSRFCHGNYYFTLTYFSVSKTSPDCSSL